MKIYQSIRLILCVGLLSLFACSPSAAPHPDSVRGFTHLRRETAGNSGKKEYVDYYESEKSTLKIITIPDATVQGTIIAVGNEPFTSLVVESTDGETYHIRPGHTDRFWKQQGKEVEITGTVQKRTISRKNGDRTIHKNWIYPEK